MEVLGKSVRIRALEPEDLPALARWHNDPAIARMLVGWSFPLSMAGQKIWFEKSLADEKTKRFAVETLSEGRLIGMTGLWDIDWKNREALTALLIGEDVRGKGYGADAIGAMMHYAFIDLGMNRLWGEILCYNTASYRAYVEKSGWKVEGVMRRKIYRNGQFNDSYLVAILRSEYEQLMGLNEEPHA